jgi:hypothetical protein
MAASSIAPLNMRSSSDTAPPRWWGFTGAYPQVHSCDDMRLPTRQPPRQAASPASAMSEVQTPAAQSAPTPAAKFSPASKASSPSPPRSPSPIATVARCATAGSTSRELVGAGALRAGLGPARRRQLPARPTARRAPPADRALGRSSRRRAGGAGDARAGVGLSPADRHQRRGGPRQPCARFGDGALVRRPVGARQRASRPCRSPRSTRRKTIPERFLIRWRGEANPDHVKAIDAYWISAAEHGMNASTFTARVVASTGADCAAALSAAVGALSGPLHGGAPVAGAEDARRGRGARRRRALGLGTRSTAASG